MDNEHNICTRCKSSKHLEDFYPQKDKKSGRRSRCIECEKHLYQINNPETLQADMLRLVKIFIWANAMEEERFIPIKHFESRYWVSDFGRVVSCDLRRGVVNFLHPFIDSCGYYQVTLRKKPQKRKVRIQTLVGEYFVDKNDITYKVINHLTGCKLFNYYKDLEWTTLKGNCAHAIETGLNDIKGEKHPQAKLTCEKVIEMRKLRESGLTYQTLSEQYGVTRRQASDVVRGVNWGWLKG